MEGNTPSAWHDVKSCGGAPCRRRGDDALVDLFEQAAAASPHGLQRLRTQSMHRAHGAENIIHHPLSNMNVSICLLETLPAPS